MTAPFVRRLQHGAYLTDDDRAALIHLVRRTREIASRQPLAEEGEPTPRVLVMLEGWAYRSKLVAGGERFITDLILPGDLCHAQSSLLSHADHSVTTMTAGQIAEVDAREIAGVIARCPGAARALSWSSLQTDSILRQSLVNIGRRLAAPRIAHLICEVRARLQAVGVSVEDGFMWPLTQEALADVTGMTGVHVNRSLKDLRVEGLIVQEKRWMRVLDVDLLAAFCGFQPGYLHLSSGPETSSAFDPTSP